MQRKRLEEISISSQLKLTKPTRGRANLLPAEEIFGRAITVGLWAEFGARDKKKGKKRLRHFMLPRGADVLGFVRWLAPFCEKILTWFDKMRGRGKDYFRNAGFLFGNHYRCFKKGRGKRKRSWSISKDVNCCKIDFLCAERLVLSSLQSFERVVRELQFDIIQHFLPKRTSSSFLSYTLYWICSCAGKRIFVNYSLKMICEPVRICKLLG